MIKPSDIDISKPVLNMDHVIDLENAFDAAIRVAAKDGSWPARVPNGNVADDVKTMEIEHVADKYRAEGWKVATGGRTERARIDHPDRKRP